MVSVDIKNTGEFDGTEVVQLYIRDLVGSITRPVRELKGFKTVSLSKGETSTVQFELTEEELGFYNGEGNWLLEKGEFEVFVGGSSDAKLSIKFEL